MVSNLPFYSFKTINMRKSVPFLVVFLAAMFFVLISSDPPRVLFAIFLCYALSGFVMWFLKRRSKPIA
jgi:CDP-diacylglycerol--serine O-phosphatidyltransferase